MADRDDMIRKVQALWARADHPNTPPAEAESAVDMARKLMAKYQIDEMVLSEKSETREAVIVKSFRITEVGRNAKVPEQRIALANQIAVHNRCRAVIESREETADVKTGKVIRAGRFITVCGYESDVAMVEALYFNVSMALMEALMDEKVQTNNYQVNFATGFVSRISSRLGAISRTVKQMADETSGMGLVLVSRESQVTDTFTKMFPNITSYKVSSKVKYDPNAEQRGRNKADSVDLGDRDRLGSGGGSRGDRELGK